MRPRALALAMVLAALGPAAAARAATTVGSDLNGTPMFSACPATSCTAFTVSASSDNPVAVSPIDGVVVRWRVKAGAEASPVVLHVLRPSGPGTYSDVGLSDPQDVPGGGTTSTYLTRIPVKAGDIIGVDAPAKAQLFAQSSTFDVFTMSSPPTTWSRQSGRELLVNADIEPDVDGDGYGDETQDLCPSDPTRHTACLANVSVSATPVPAPVTVDRPVAFTIKVANDGPSIAQNVGLVVNVPTSATPLNVRVGNRGTCAGAFPVTCRLNSLGPGEAVDVILTVRPEAVGTLTMTAQGSTTTDDSNPADNSFTSTVTVLPPALRLIDLRLTRYAIPQGGATAIRWYMTDAAAVTVRVQQITRRGRLRPAGAFIVRGHPGSNAVAFRGGIPPRRRPLKPGNYRFMVSAATPDGRVATPHHVRFSVLRGHR